MNPITNRFEQLAVGVSIGEHGLIIPEQSSLLLRPNGEPVPQHWVQFRLGELVVIKNYTFRVAYIGETAILFEPAGASVAP